MRPASFACIVLSVAVIGLVIALSCRRSTVAADDEAISRSAEPALPPQPAFVASPTFAGPRKNYVFKSGSQGVGYYLEAPPQGRKRSSQASATSADMPPPSSGSGAASARASNDVERGQLRSRRTTGVDTTAQAVARRRQSNGFWDDEL